MMDDHALFEDDTRRNHRQRPFSRSLRYLGGLLAERDATAPWSMEQGSGQHEVAETALIATVFQQVRGIAFGSR